MTYKEHAPSPVGALLKQLREDRGLPLWQVAAAARMDSTLLSKVERGHRFLQPDQVSLLEKFFGFPRGGIERLNIAAKFWHDYSDNPAAGAAVEAIRETAPRFIVNKPVNKRRKSTG